MAEGVAEVQERTITGLALVGGDNRRLHLATDLDRPRQGCRFKVAHGSALGLQPFKEGGVTDQTVFDGLTISGGQLSAGKRGKAAGIRKNEAGLVERPE